VSAVFLHLYDGGLCWVLKKFLSKELNVRVEAYNFDAQTKPWLSINSGDPQITEDLSVRHLAETPSFCICTMVVCVGCLKASLSVLSLTLSSDSGWNRIW
jgi:hypothetical protein